MIPETERRARQLSELWDHLQAEEPVDESSADLDFINTLRAISDFDQMRPIADRLQEQIWNNVISGTAELWRPTGAETAATPVEAPTHRNKSAIVMRFAWVIVAGLIGGFVAGIGSRLFMRLAGFLTADENRFRLTENDARVGEITLGGTISLGLLGAGAGVVTILIYLAIRDRLPFDGWRRSSVFAILLLLVFGYVIMDPSNPDYQLFGPTWLNVSTFSSLYLLLGFCCGQTYELGNRHAAKLISARQRLVIRIPVVVLSGLACAFGLLVVMTAMIIGAAGLIVLAVAGLAWLAERYLKLDRVLLYRMPDLIRPWGTLVVPGIVGFVLTARGIAEILLNR